MTQDKSTSSMKCTPFEEALIIEEITVQVWEQAMANPFKFSIICLWLELHGILESRILLVSPPQIRLATKDGKLVSH